MTVSLTTAESALKTVYLDTVVDAINTKTNPFLTIVNRTSCDIWGKNIMKVIKKGVNGGMKAGTETDDLPISSGVDYETLTLPLKNFYGTIEISDKALRASANHAGAFVDLLNAEMESLINSCKNNFGRMLFGDGSGKLATVVQTGLNGTCTVDSVKLLQEGMIIDFISPGGYVIPCVKNRKIVSIDREHNTIQIDGEPGWLNGVVDGSYITIQGSLNNELTGLEAIFSKEGSIYGLDKKVHKFLNPYIKENQGEITEEALQKAIDTIEENTGNSINYIVCSFGVKRALQALFLKNYISLDVAELAGGYKAMSYNGIPIVADRFCPEGTLYLLNTDDFELHQLCDWSWLDSEDGRILHQIPGKPVYSATLVKYANLLCSKPCGQGKISGITEK